MKRRDLLSSSAQAGSVAGTPRFEVMTLRASIRCGLAAVVSEAGVTAALPGFAQGNPERNVYFGQTHVHTSWSFDAYVFGNTVTGPEEAYKYALGQPIKHPGGYTVQLKRPLDFQAVTDHAEYVGTVRLANDPGSALSKLPIADKLKVRSKDDIQKDLPFPRRLHCSRTSRSRSSSTRKWPAASGNRPSRSPTSTISRESSRPLRPMNGPRRRTTCNLHRNVIFKDTKKVPDVPFTSIDSTHPEDLWAWMDAQRRAGNELLAISHNANLSDGVMFPLDVDSKGRPIDAAWAQDRMNNEPLSEITQLKGTSETHPSLSPNDEFASFEILTYLLGGATRAPRIHGSYIREAYQNGLGMQDARGYNPYKFGVVGASDSHDTAVAYMQSNYFGGHGLLDATPQARLSGKEDSRSDDGFAQRVGPRRRLGRGEYARVDLRRHAAQGDVRHQRPAHQGAAVRRLGFWPRRAEAEGLGQDRLCQWRADGRRPAAAKGQGADVHRVGGQGSRRGQSGPHPDRQGLDQERPDLREDL